MRIFFFSHESFVWLQQKFTYTAQSLHINFFTDFRRCFSLVCAVCRSYVNAIHGYQLPKSHNFYLPAQFIVFESEASMLPHKVEMYIESKQRLLFQTHNFAKSYCHVFRGYRVQAFDTQKHCLWRVRVFFHWLAWHENNSSSQKREKNYITSR